MKKVALRFYNANNLGDDLFVKIITERYTDKFFFYKNQTTVAFRRIVNLSSSGGKLTNFIYRVRQKLGDSMDLGIRRIVCKSDLLVYVGGSIFIEGNSIPYWEQELGFYRSLDKPYYILSSNFGPYKDPTFVNIVRGIVASAQDVCFRDQSSYEIFKNILSARVATDIAFTLDTSEFSTVKQEKLVVFSVIDAYKKFDEETAVKYEQEIINLSSKFVNDGYRVTFMSFCKFEGDEDAIKCIMTKMDESLRQKIDTYMYRGDLNEALAALASSEIIVASRFHASILGLVLGKKILPLAYSDKTTNILNDMNFKGPVVDIRKIDAFDGSTFDINSLQYNDVSDQKKLAEKQFQELDKVLIKRK